MEQSVRASWKRQLCKQPGVALTALIKGASIDVASLDRELFKGRRPVLLCLFSQPFPGPASPHNRGVLSE